MNKWILTSLCGAALLTASGCGSQTAAPQSSTAAVAANAIASPPSPATMTVTPSPKPAMSASPTVTTAPSPSLSPSPSPAAAASTTPKPQPSKETTPSATMAKTETESAAPSPAPTPDPAPTAKSLPAENADVHAEKLYKSNCLACHGTGLQGDFGPNLTQVGSRKTKDQIVNQIMKGKGDMPPFKDTLKTEDIEALATWLAAKK
ncbi:cytochrome c [Paenibacillus sp. N3.4]|uniref:c-type cytochrome n=1 Tax=Paenibacillus sp. N3.4 TaxID=2603222 RepID=UPI0011CA3682|nr:cytochrome c [Paenibacillus sp. N3.4]TXK83836.1 cytochrome c [Paenibacillus sp. N3.4]